jgi:hypothetical protein
MSRKLKFLTAGAVILLGVLFLMVWGCQMPAGVGSARSVVGEGGEELSLTDWTPGSLSVEMDEERGVAVYVNENGERFDVSAEEYPGGPLIACVEVESFAEVPPNDDPEALAVKAIVGGVRSDGELGAWAIHLDDSINLTVDENGEARCLGGSSSGSILDGMQARYGWRYEILGSASDNEGRTMVIVGKAKNPRGFLYGSVEVLPESWVAVYWRVWRLPYSRFRIITPPRVIGTYEAAPAPAAAAELEPHFAEILVRLRQFFHGRLESYLVKLDNNPISWDDQACLFLVRGTDQAGNGAIARIDRSGNVRIEPLEPSPPPPPEPPDLTLSNLSVEAIRGGQPLDEGAVLWGTDQLTIKVEVTNQGAGEAEESPIEVGIASSDWSEAASLGRLEPGESAEKVFGPYPVETLADTKDDTSGQALTYLLVATVNASGAVPEDPAEDPTADSAELSLSVGTPKLVLLSLGPLTITKEESVDATVENQGTAPSGEATLEIGISEQEDSSSFTFAGLEPGKQRFFSFTPMVVPGVWELFAHLDGQITKAELTIESPEPDVYNRIVIQTYPVLDQEGNSNAGFVVATLLDKPSWNPEWDGEEVDLFWVPPVEAGALVYNNGIIDGNETYGAYNQLVYAPEGGIPGGTTLYLRIWAAFNKTNQGRYAVRLLADPSDAAIDDYDGWLYTDDSTFDGTTEADGTTIPYEPDDTGDGLISATLTAGQDIEAQSVNRYMAPAPDADSPGDVDWVVVKLPEK